jgi:2-dehydro-3-deoxyphosphogluconate aldolase/(4S)-4-hydroxy-2-oxoglutarate aldolase
MNDHQKTLDAILESRIVSIIRMRPPAYPVDAVRAVATGGIRVIEVTLNTPGALRAIEESRKQFGDEVIMGAGTVLNPADARAAADAGAQFIVSPDTNPDVIRVTKAAELVSIPGALTPTEIAAADRAGADLIKLFPASLHGPGYVKEVLAPLDHVKLVPTGGVRLQNLSEWFEAGATAVALGSSLVNQDLVDALDWDTITTSSRAYANAVKDITP